MAYWSRRIALLPAELTILNFETGNLKCTIAGLNKTTGCLASRKNIFETKDCTFE